MSSYKLLKDKIIKNRTKIEIISLFFIVLAGLIFSSNYFKKKPRQAEVFLITNQDHTAYFELSANRTSINANQETEITVKIATTGEEFNTSAAVVEWNPSHFSYVSDSTVANTSLTGTFIPAFIGGNAGSGRYVLSYVVIPPNSNMSTAKGALVHYAAFRLKALQNNPSSVIKLSSLSGDLGIVFVDGTPASINQSLSAKTEISFTAGASPSPSPSKSPSPSPSRSPGTQTSTSPSPSPSPSKSPSPSPSQAAGGPVVNLKLKFDGVPANDNEINLSNIHRSKEILIEVSRQESLWALNYSLLTPFTYNGSDKSWNAAINFIPPDWQGGHYIFKIKGPYHRKMIFCQDNQGMEECGRNSTIELLMGNTYNLNFTGHPLEFGDYNYDYVVGVADYSAVKACKALNAKIGDDNYENKDCQFGDGNFDGVVDSTDMVLLYKTLSTKPDDE